MAEMSRGDTAAGCVTIRRTLGAEVDVRERTELEVLLRLSGDAFEHDPDNSLLANLRGVRPEDWTALPAGGGRTIADLLEHVGWAKWMYADYAFGPATLRGDAPPMIPAGGARSRPPEELVAWVTEGHRRWLASVQALADDAELAVERRTNWGARLPTRTLIRIVMAHDWYHAGEINHLRTLLQNTDRWPYE